jgi:hypothetical protein
MAYVKKTRRIADEDESVEAVPEPVVEAPVVVDPPGTFPRMLYGPGGTQKIVATRSAQQALGMEWRESPADGS